MSFEPTFDELALKLREEAVRRFATGRAIPAERLAVGVVLARSAQ
ncbi:hypothetical protein ACH444_36770 [Streptomyces microflavus]